MGSMGIRNIGPYWMVMMEICDLICKDFKCERCGRCCTNARIALYFDDIEKISEHLKMNGEDFVKKYLKREKKDWAFRSKPCPFYNDKEKKCDIHPVRPFMCRSFPAFSPVLLNIIPGATNALINGMHPKYERKGSTCLSDILGELNDYIMKGIKAAQSRIDDNE